MSETHPLHSLRQQLLQRWTAFPADKSAALDAELQTALAAASAADPETITVMNPVSRPRRLQLAILVTDVALDAMYQQAWAELAVSNDGRCYLVYRRHDDGDYAIEWSPATTLPATMASRLSDALSLALLGNDNDDSA